MELVIDTSSNRAGVALADHGTVREEVVWQTEQNHTVELLPHIVSILRKCDADVHALEAIVVDRGPGSFNGLRVGLATAKGLAFALRIPMAAVSALEAIAFAHADRGLPVCPVTNVSRGDLATALFEMQDGRWVRIVDEHLTTIPELPSTITQPTLLCGDTEGVLAGDICPQIILASSSTQKPATLPPMGCLSQLGWRRILMDGGDDPRTIQPLYLRRPSITVPRKRSQDAMSYMWPRR